MSLSAILSDDYQDILDGADISPVFSFDGRGEDFEMYFEEELDAEQIIWKDGKYAITEVDYDLQTVLLFHEEKVVGFYFDMMAWLDPEHRGKGLATQMILSYAEHFGENAFSLSREKSEGGMGFSEEGYDLHFRAKQIAEDRLTSSADAAAKP